MPGTSAAPDLSLRELARWAEGQARRLADSFGLDSATDGDNAYLAGAVSRKIEHLEARNRQAELTA